MITTILLILIGLELDMMNGLFLALIITRIILWMIEIILKTLKIGLKIKDK